MLEARVPHTSPDSLPLVVLDVAEPHVSLSVDQADCNSGNNEGAQAVRSPGCSLCLIPFVCGAALLGSLLVRFNIRMGKDGNYGWLGPTLPELTPRQCWSGIHLPKGALATPPEGGFDRTDWVVAVRR